MVPKTLCFEFLRRVFTFVKFSLLLSFHFCMTFEFSLNGHFRSQHWFVHEAQLTDLVCAIYRPCTLSDKLISKQQSIVKGVPFSKLCTRVGDSVDWSR